MLGENALTYLLQKIKQMKSDLQTEISQKSDFSGNYDDLSNKPTIPTKLPNPQAVTFTGGATGSYDGSAPLTVNIPAPSGMTAATADELGGIQADAKESGDTVPAKIGTDNKLYVPSYPTQMKGASASSAGAGGLVPGPAAGKQNQYLRGDGTWGTPPNTTYSNMSGASSSAAGKAGLVPAPSAGASNRYLRSDGTWAVPPDTNTMYSTGNATTAGITKLYTSTGTSTDGTMTRAAITTALNGKAASFDEDGSLADTD